MKKRFSLLFLLLALSPYQFACADGGSVTNNRYNSSLIGGIGSVGPTGPSGPTGATGPSGSGFASSYGQLILSMTQSMDFNAPNTWVAIPFDAFDLSSNMDGSTTPPATITISQTGVYQMNTSLYFSSEDSPEDTFTQTTYTLGISINGGMQIACASVYAGEPGFFSLNFSALMAFSPTDTIQFYMKSSAIGGGGIIFENIVTLVNGNAHLVQIAN